MEKLKYKSYSWDKEFEIKGCFSNNKTKVASRDANNGILKYSSSEIILEIFVEFPNNDGITYGFGPSIGKIYSLQQLCQEVLRYYIFKGLGLKYYEKY